METLEKLKEILAECKGEDIEVTPETTFDELDFDSLDKVDIVMQIEEAYDITPETTFDELEFDSLDKVDIVMQIEEAYGISLGDNMQLSTVGELIQKIDEAVAAK